MKKISRNTYDVRSSNERVRETCSKIQKKKKKRKDLERVAANNTNNGERGMSRESDENYRELRAGSDKRVKRVRKDALTGERSREHTLCSSVGRGVCRAFSQINVPLESVFGTGRRVRARSLSAHGGAPLREQEERGRKVGESLRRNWSSWREKERYMYVYLCRGAWFSVYRILYWILYRIVRRDAVFRADRSGPFGCAASTEAPFARSVRW